MQRLLQAALKTVFPDQCVLCGALTESDAGLCSSCWRETPFLLARGCQFCGAPLLGGDAYGAACCEDCHAHPRPWIEGSSVLLYSGAARRLVMAVKHGDRLDLLPQLARWMVPKVRPMVQDNMVVVPVPIHWRRLLTRKHNQAAGLARNLAKELQLPCLPDALIRTRATRPLKELSYEERFARQAGSVAPAPLWRDHLAGRPVLLVDDVMTSGATLGACAEACHDAGASQVYVATLARAVRNP